MCIGVLIHHLYQFTGFFQNTYFGHALNLLGSWAVAVFIFLSGYGIYCSYSEKGDSYIRQFLKNRFLPLYLSYVLAVVFYFIFDLKNGIGIKAVLKSLTWGGTIVSFGWYFQMLFVLYIAFFLVFRFFKNRYIRNLVIGLCCILYVAAAYLTGENYIPVISFLFGLFSAVHRNDIGKIAHKFTGLLMVISFPIFFLMYLLYVWGVIMGKFALQGILLDLVLTVSDIAIIIFIICFAIICDKCRIPVMTNPVIGFFGEHMLEIYVLQGLSYRFFAKYIDNKLLFSFISVSCIILLSIPYHWINRKIKRVITDK